MKKTISHLLLITFLANTTLPAVAQTNLNRESVSPQTSGTRSGFEILFSNYKKQVLVDGVSTELASEEFVRNVLDANISTDEIRGYALKSMSYENFQEFEKILARGIQSLNGQVLSDKKVARLVVSLVEGQQKEGANWVSCGVGLGIGIPLLVAGVVTGIVALSLKETKKSIIEKKYVQQRQKALDEYTSIENKRQDDIVAIQSDIDAYNNAIAELERRINSGNYGTIDAELMRQQIAEYRVNISDSNAAIAQLNNDQPQVYQSYQTKIQYINELENNELKNSSERDEIMRKKKTTLSIISGLTLAMGVTGVIKGSEDCMY